MGGLVCGEENGAKGKILKIGNNSSATEEIDRAAVVAGKKNKVLCFVA